MIGDERPIADGETERRRDGARLSFSLHLGRRQGAKGDVLQGAIADDEQPLPPQLRSDG
jgi:hypothetical protein